MESAGLVSCFSGGAPTDGEARRTAFASLGRELAGEALILCDTPMIRPRQTDSLGKSSATPITILLIDFVVETIRRKYPLGPSTRCALREANASLVASKPLSPVSDMQGVPVPKGFSYLWAARPFTYARSQPLRLRFGKSRFLACARAGDRTDWHEPGGQGSCSHLVEQNRGAGCLTRCSASMQRRAGEICRIFEVEGRGTPFLMRGHRAGRIS